MLIIFILLTFPFKNLSCLILIIIAWNPEETHGKQHFLNSGKARLKGEEVNGIIGCVQAQVASSFSLQVLKVSRQERNGS